MGRITTKPFPQFPCKRPNRVKNRVIKKWVKRLVKYYRNPKNEFGFVVLTLHNIFTNLPANILIDDSGVWSNIGNKKIILFQANTFVGVNFNTIIPMTVEPESQILIKNEKIQLTAAKMEQIKNFVIQCQTAIIELGGGKISTVEFFEILREKGIKNEKTF